jgi:uncharacterized protein YciI
MKSVITITSVLLILCVSVISCREKDRPSSNETPQSEATPPEDVTQSEYDSTAAAKYGADDYGMKSYVMAFLKKGPNRDLDSAKAQELQMAHLENIGRMADEGKLALAGPFLDDGDLRGIYIFNVETIEEAEELTMSDPAIQAGSLIMELKGWYGSAGLMAVNEIHSKLAKVSFSTD